MSDLQAYLASKYLSGAKADAILARAADDGTGKRKKKKRKVDTTSTTAAGTGTGLLIADDDDLGGWNGRGRDSDEDNEEKAVVETKRGEFKGKGTAASWETVRPATTSNNTPTESTEDVVPADEQPAVVVDESVSAPAPAPKPRGGLRTAAELRADNERAEAERARKKADYDRMLAQQKAEREAARAERGGEDDGDDDEDDPQATVYRDASGKRIDVKLKKAELAKQKREELEKEMARMEWGKGLVQKDDAKRRKEEAEKLKHKPVARYADDKELNDELKEREIWNDPAAAFLTKKKDKPSKLGFPRYAGPPPPPNRFGIPPGYRWDGVDRSNGFERKWMQVQNERRAKTAQSHAYSTADM